jgi:ABC-type transport system involved in multi-copper enzyme maturation permease subunit
MLGPVFRFELITTARRKRYFVARFVYGMLLLFSLCSQYDIGPWSANIAFRVAPDSIDELSQFAQRMFTALAWAQGVALIGLIPALLAGVIADEAQRRTLQYLLASPMSSAAIVLEKLTARLVHVGVIVLMGVPVVCLLALLGGLDPLEVSYIYGGTISLVLFLSGLSLFVSVLARGPREAILVAYVLVFVWLFLPRLIEPIAHHMDWPLNWVGPVNDFVLLTNPAHVWDMMTNRLYYFNPMWRTNRTWVLQWLAGARSEILVYFAWMGGLQSLFGVLFVLLAVVALRPLKGGERRSERKKVRGHLLATIGSALRTVPVRPPCDEDDPMLWKERFATGGGFTWLRSRPVVLFLSVLLGCYLFDTSLPAFRALGGWGSGAGGGTDRRLVLNGALRESSTLLFVLLILSVASAAAVSLTSEREQDTWTSLSGTLLSGREIVWGKIRGAVWSSWRLVLALAIMGLVGLLAGAIFPLGLLLAASGLFVFCGFTAALGVWISLRARNSTRALFTTIFWLMVFNGGYLILIPGALRESDLACAWVMPYMQWLSLISYPDASRFFAGEPFEVPGFAGSHGLDALVAVLVALFVYGMGALILAGAAVDGLEKTSAQATGEAGVGIAAAKRQLPDPCA